ncbi:MAG: hypothetical protein ACO3F3_15025 [Gemmataceae bacterium]
MTQRNVQRDRTQNNPLNMGQFSQLSLRNLKGKLGPQNRVVGYRDTRQLSNGGYGGGEYNHWFSFTLISKAWLIIAKGGPRPNYINTSVYDLNLNPIEGRGIFQDDSITVSINGDVYNPYVGQVMSAQSDIYNTFNPNRFDKGDERYYPLQSGTYLICVSTTRNEPLDYEVGVIVEFPSGDFDILFEDYAYILLENNDFILNDHTEFYDGQDAHDHSLSEWEEAWQREHQADDRFPAFFVPLATVP